MEQALKSADFGWSWVYVMKICTIVHKIFCMIVHKNFTTVWSTPVNRNKLQLTGFLHSGFGYRFLITGIISYRFFLAPPKMRMECVIKYIYIYVR